jgi:hypothetical protein
MVPDEVNASSNSTTMLFVPCPLLIEDPVGTVHAKLTSGLGLTLKVLISPGQTFAVPPLSVIVPGDAGTFLAIVSAFAVLVPHGFVAFTDKVPEVVKLPLNDMVILLVPCPLRMIPPVGGVQV